MNEQHFTKDGTWFKPEGAVTVKVQLKGGTGQPGRRNLGGRGGEATIFWAPNLMAGGGGGGAGVSAVSTPTEVRVAGIGGQGAEVSETYQASELPALSDVRVGEGGYATIISFMAGES